MRLYAKCFELPEGVFCQIGIYSETLSSMLNDILLSVGIGGRPQTFGLSISLTLRPRLQEDKFILTGVDINHSFTRAILSFKKKGLSHYLLI